MAKKASLGRLSAEVDARNTRFKKVMGETAAIARRDSRAISRSLREVGVTSKGMGKAVRGGLAAFSGMAIGVAGLVVGLKGAVNSFTNVSKGVREISTLMGGLTDRELEDMRKELQGLAVDSGKAIDGLVKARYDIVSAGFSDAAESAMVLNQATSLAVAGVAEVSETADLLTTALNAWGMAADQVQVVSDKLFETVRLGKTTIPELASTLGKAAAVAAPLGVTLDDILGSVANLTAAGQSTDEAFTAIRASIVELAKPGKQLRTILNNIGFSSGRAAIDELGFAKAMGAVAKEAERLDIPLTDVLGNIRSMQAALPLTGDGAERLADSIEQIGDASGSTAKAAGEMMEEVDVQFARFKEAIKVIGSNIGEHIAGPLGKAAGGIADLVLGDIKGPGGDSQKDIIRKRADEQADALQRARAQLILLQAVQKKQGFGVFAKEVRDAKNDVTNAWLSLRKLTKEFDRLVAEERGDLSDKFVVDPAKMRELEKAAEAVAALGDGDPVEVFDWKNIMDSLEVLKGFDGAAEEVFDSLDVSDEQKKANDERVKSIVRFNDEFVALSMDQFDFQREILDQEVEAWRAAQISETEIQKRESERRKQISISELMAKLDMAQQFLNGIGEIAMNMTDAENSRTEARVEGRLEAEQRLFDGQKAAIEKSNSVDGRLTSKGRKDLEAIEDRHRSKMDAIREQGVEDRRKSGKKMKAIQKTQAVLSWLTAVADAYATQPFIPKGLASGLLATGIMGAQIAAIDAQKFGDGAAFGGQGVIPVPTLFDTGNGPGVAGEVGEEGILPLSRGPGGKLGVNAVGGMNAGNVINLSLAFNGPTPVEFMHETIEMVTQLAIDNGTDIVIGRDLIETDDGLKFKRTGG